MDFKEMNISNAPGALRCKAQILSENPTSFRGMSGVCLIHWLTQAPPLLPKIYEKLSV